MTGQPTPGQPTPGQPTPGQPMLLFFLNARENNEMRIILALVSNPGLDRATIPRPVRKTRPRKVWR